MGGNFVDPKLYLDTMPNLTGIRHKQTHILELKPMCPVSKNPAPGSKVEITYTPDKYFAEVYSLKAFVDSFIGGRKYKGTDVRDMEQTIQCIYNECAMVLEVPVYVAATIILDTQEMIIKIGKEQ